ncbi:hypothetical protein AMTRI_Chr05g62600 [Amborella trichopoda]
MDGGNIKLSLDKLPIRRVDAVDENGTEHFPPSDVNQDEKYLSLLRRIDFTPVVEKDAKKQKVSRENQASQQWPWQSLVENLRQAHHELSVIIDLVHNVEANDAVAVAGMTRPKPLPNEVLSDLAISTSTKLQCFQHVGKYLKQSAKALEHQVAREARFYGSLIRLQQNWKVKRQRALAAPSGSEGFTFDLSDISLSDPLLFRTSSLSTVRIEHDSTGMLAVTLPPNSCHALFLGFRDGPSSTIPIQPAGSNIDSLREGFDCGAKKETATNEDVNECLKETHALLRSIHRAIFDEQVFDWVNREAFNGSPGVNVTGMRENFLQLSLNPEISVCLKLLASNKDDQSESQNGIHNEGSRVVSVDLSEGSGASDARLKNTQEKEQNWLPDALSCEIYLQQLLLENVFGRDREIRAPVKCGSNKVQGSMKPIGDGFGFLGHFCVSLSHRIFSHKVLVDLENLAARVPYVHLLSHPTWNSRISAWSLYMKVPQSIMHLGKTKPETFDLEKGIRSQFYTKVVVNDESICIEGEAAPSVVGLFRSDSVEVRSISGYHCGLEDLTPMLLQQVASQVVHWIHEEALIVGMKVTRDFLSLWFEVEQGDRLGLVARIDQDDPHCCIGWWLVLEDARMEGHPDLSNGGSSESKKFLGHLSLESLYAVLMDLVSLCSSSGTS